jgi:hypothetical protein
VTFQWTSGPELTALQIIEVCPQHAHFELEGEDGTAVAGGIISRGECLELAGLLLATVEALDMETAEEETWIANGIAQLESLSGV